MSDNGQEQLSASACLWAVAIVRKQEPLIQFYSHLLVFLSRKYGFNVSQVTSASLSGVAAMDKLHGPDEADRLVERLIVPLYDDIAEMLCDADVELPEEITQRQVH